MRLPRARRTSPTIPTASMADIAFLLLIFFICTTIFRIEEHGMVDLPSAHEGRDIEAKSRVTVELTGEGALLVDQQPSDRAALEAFLTAGTAEAQTPLVSLRIDRDVPSSVVSDLIEAIKRAGIRELEFVVEAGSAGD